MGLHVACRTPTYTVRVAHRLFCNALVYRPRRFVKTMTPQLTRMLEKSVMPKVLVLVTGDNDQSKFLADCVGDGARAVRFTEVDVRRLASDEPAQLREYDGVVFVGPNGELGPALTRLLDACESADASEFATTIFASAGFEGGSVLERIARLGGIIVAERPSELAPEARAKLVGKRVGKVAEWVRHALSHEHGHHDHVH
jgi:hypothetical protein